MIDGRYQIGLLNPAYYPLLKSIDRTNGRLLKYPSSRNLPHPARNGPALKHRCLLHLRDFRWTLCLMLLLLLVGGMAQGQGLQSLSGFGLSGSDAGGQKLKASGYFTAAANGRPAMLFVTAELAPDWHTYSLTQARRAAQDED